MKRVLNDFFSLLYPRLCGACGESLFSGEQTICTACRLNLPFTFFSKEKENKLTQFFWGRLPLEGGAALLYFQKGGKVQHLVHQFKYKGHSEIGHLLGAMLGAELRESPHFQDIDFIIPVPLHPAKLASRGFNQSEVFGRGLSEALGIAQVTNGLVRVVATETQTRKARFSRWKNVETVFEVNNPQRFANKNLLIVDDVVTTGSTLEACAQKLLEIDGVKIWLATLAIST